MELKNLRTNYLGRNLLYFKTIDSTQKKIKSLEEPENGTLIMADQQIAGVGTHERKWFTGAGKNIAMSLVLLPNCNLQEIEHLTVCIADCMIETLDFLYQIKLERKDPNDIYYRGKKVGGILTQSSCKGECVERIYVGVGLNVNQEEFDEDLSQIATSLKIEFGRDFKREEIVTEFLNRFEIEFEKMIGFGEKNGNFNRGI